QDEEPDPSAPASTNPWSLLSGPASQSLLSPSIAQSEHQIPSDLHPPPTASAPQIQPGTGPPPPPLPITFRSAHDYPNHTSWGAGSHAHPSAQAQWRRG